jgi:hypothetical protein
VQRGIACCGATHGVGRSRSLLKVKSFSDEEGIVVGHQGGRWRHLSLFSSLHFRHNIPSFVSSLLSTVVLLLALLHAADDAHVFVWSVHVHVPEQDTGRTRARELFHQISLVSPLFFARALWQIALPTLGGVAAICHRPLGVWHPKKEAKPDQF